MNTSISRISQISFTTLRTLAQINPLIKPAESVIASFTCCLKFKHSKLPHEDHNQNYDN